MIDKLSLKQKAAAIGVELDDTALARFDEYAAFLVDYNQNVNLTAITEPEDIVVKHFTDSLSLLPVIDPAQNAKIADVGAGAGFPSVPLLIARPDLKITMVDSSNKRVTFLNLLLEKLELTQSGSQAIHMRAEEAGASPKYREKFDFAVARAVANLRELSEYCIPLVKVGGTFASMKGAEIEEELAGAKNAIGTLGGKTERVEKFTLPNGDGRSVVVIKKISQTQTKYPRPSAKIAKKPLI
ncbi:MAG: 16S rRNA (guanine(527)-N(7))-methyltransferase RsmG [Oscillospiraceae bacterium]|nr:16S rRNA (guanine(527)-N(7))-methyltransferase RsmG [Oscillospiraceae bacterium]MBQ3049775.1 16S rRNA (guanine(527)-N(7))-methyltransferase RsmG [Oscillospiraceae bacterium]MBQ9939463.1 16S rRNA (guanine(527)-N(7))-methyltransferase RsmG [Oscillospiraceae bacterium]